MYYVELLVDSMCIFYRKISLGPDHLESIILKIIIGQKYYDQEKNREKP